MTPIPFCFRCLDASNPKFCKKFGELADKCHDEYSRRDGPSEGKLKRGVGKFLGQLVEEILDLPLPLASWQQKPWVLRNLLCVPGQTV